jgi:translation initiation factor 3 subunit B
MYWHPQGTYFCVKVDYTPKGKKGKHTAFEIFHIQEKNSPTEMVELTDTAITFAFEPRGNHFATIHGELPRPNVSFYQIGKKTTLLSKSLCFCIIFVTTIDNFV